MSLPVHVAVYSGYKANARPRNFVLDEEIHEIAAVLDQWHEPSATYFKVEIKVSPLRIFAILGIRKSTSDTLLAPDFQTRTFWMLSEIEKEPRMTAHRGSQSTLP